MFNSSEEGCVRVFFVGTQNVKAPKRIICNYFANMKFLSVANMTFAQTNYNYIVLFLDRKSNELDFD